MHSVSGSAMPGGQEHALLMREAGTEARFESKEVFGQLLRRIRYSDRGDQKTEQPRISMPTSEKTLANVENQVNQDWDACYKQATTALQLGKFELAETLWLKALEISATLPAKDPRLPQTLDNLANFYFVWGQYDKAQAFALQTLEKTKNVYGEVHAQVASCLNNIAGIYFAQRLYKKAEPYCIQALEVYCQLYGADHPDLGVAHNNVALLYHAQEKFKLARTHYEKAIPIRASALGNHHPSVELLVNRYLELLQALGEDEIVSSIRAARRDEIPWRLFDANITLPRQLQAV